MAFIVSVDYESFRKAEDIVFKEANAVEKIHNDLAIFGEPFKSEVSREIVNYAKSVVENEWVEINHSKPHNSADKLLERIRVHIYTYEPKTEREKFFYPFLLENYRTMAEMRIDRLIMSGSHLPVVLYAFMITGYFITVIFSFFFSTLHTKVQIAMTSLLSLSFMLILFLIITMDLPFSGDNSVSSEPIETVIKHINIPHP
ncbi:integral membrane protein [Candidatus Omnitrophus magneticus]|uniref:Integral membrane protein n=1 Tax=Candidatus Omnitrophus magneticus TaxID=1609969 RepID=A0A0F0CRZ2_9BACT|nr:integral membrane protein [Candidatus Omnitrophus magneticus]